MDVYKACPEVGDGRFRLRLVRREDCSELLKVYSDPAAVPLFNSDNCNGDDFFYRTMERMMQGIEMWLWSYDHGWFVRWTILDGNEAVGTVELFARDQQHADAHEAILRLDLRSDYERQEPVRAILALLLPAAFDWFGAARILTKAKPIAQRRIHILQEFGFAPLTEPMTAHDGSPLGDYWVLRKE